MLQIKPGYVNAVGSKPLEDFYFSSKARTTRDHTCKKCKCSKPRSPEYQQRHRERSSKILTHKRAFVRRYKQICGCVVCGLREPSALDLHHRDPSTKLFEPANLGRQSMETIKAELRKCVVLCANHHRMVHAGDIILEATNGNDTSTNG